MHLRKLTWQGIVLACVVAGGLGGCGDDGANEADLIGVASTCADHSDCPAVESLDGGTVDLVCLTQFSGGYCGLPGCSTSADCPRGAVCVRHTDGQRYCFRECVDKSECNRNRPPGLEANCSANFDFNHPSDDVGQKACIPPSSGT